MSLIREFSCFDLFKFNKVNLDPLTETYGLSFYMSYQARWPEYFYTAEAPNGEIQGFSGVHSRFRIWLLHKT